MGIPRLSQDLHPYGGRVSLGTSKNSHSAHSAVDSLIIDGPSLVYFVYNRLLAHQSLNLLADASLPPTYTQINLAVHFLLTDLQDHGVAIQHIFFDGALPHAKRNVRLDRMEKLRQQLEAYRKAYPDFPRVANSNQIPEFENVIWNTPTSSTRRSTLLAPPFMVASVIESLRYSEWKTKIHVVLGEADEFCAFAVRDSISATGILTNDSDLAVHDLGPRGQVIVLQTLEKNERASLNDSCITALSFQPINIAARLNLASLLRFGFERFLDASASTPIILERARDSSRLETHNAEYQAFSEQYLPSSPSITDPLPCFEDVDPRTAELIVELTDSPQICLTPLLEDPSRDSSWSYGADVRRLAYSLLLAADPKIRTSRAVIEYARKGQRIASTPISALNWSELQCSLARILQLLYRYVPSQTTSSASPNPELGITTWYVVAIHIMRQQKLELHKSPPTSSRIIHLLGLPMTARPSSTRMTWDDIHLLANIHAVLYSLRMLRQITRYVLARSSENRTEIQDDETFLKSLQQLHRRLGSMPPISDLFLDIPRLRNQMNLLDLEERNTAIVRLKEMFDTGPDVSGDEDAITRGIDQSQVNESDKWISTKAKKKKTSKRGKEREESNTISGRMQATNIFSLLVEE